MPHTDRHGIFFQLICHRTEPGRNGFHQDLLCILSSEKKFDLRCQFFIDLGQAADLTAAPAVEHIHDRLLHDRIHQCICDAAVQISHMPGNYALDSAGLYEVVHLFPEGTDILVDPSAVGKPARD